MLESVISVDKLNSEYKSSTDVRQASVRSSVCKFVNPSLLSDHSELPRFVMISATSCHSHSEGPTFYWTIFSIYRQITVNTCALNSGTYNKMVHWHSRGPVSHLVHRWGSWRGSLTLELECALLQAFMCNKNGNQWERTHAHDLHDTPVKGAVFTKNLKT